MRRRQWIVAVAILAAGCSSSTKSSKSTKTTKSSRPGASRSKSGRSTGRQKMNSGPQGFSNVLVPAYIEDLKSGPVDKKVAAARELGNMGATAKDALPVLEKLASDANPQVSSAAKSAVAAIKKR
ncbi:MAG: hypothetical protein ACKOSQ_06075 [Planctomycetaceae bacterium]